MTSWPAGLLGSGAVGLFNGVDQTMNVPGVRTNLTLVGGPDGAAGELVLRDAAGVERGRTAFTRAPSEWGQRSVADWFGTSASVVAGLSSATVPENARIDVVVGSGALDAFVSRIDNGSGDAVTRPVALPGGGDCSKVSIASFAAAPQPVRADVETTFSWTVAIDPPSAELTSQSIRFDGEAEIDLDKAARSYTRTFAVSGPRSATLTVRKGSCVKTRSLTFFACGALSIDPVLLKDGVAFSSYGPRQLTVAGATPPTTFAVTSGELPDGLTLSADGLLSGVPTDPRTATFTVTATDANGCTGTRDYTLRIECPNLVISPATLGAGTVGTPYGTVRFTVAGGSGTGTWSAVGLPPGLALSADGRLTGTPTTAGSYPVSVRFRDSSGCTAAASYTITVCNTLAVGPGSLPPATATLAYAPVPFTVTGATGAATWSVTTGLLPAGMALDPSTGVLSGTPTVVGTFPFTVTATDSLGCTGSVAVTLVVGCPTITVNPATLVAAFEDQAYAATLTQTGGGAGTTTFAVTAGALPTGVTLAPGGALAGTAAVPGTYTFTVTATDAALGCSGSRPYSLLVTPVNDAPSFTKGPDVAILEDSGPYSAGWATSISAGPADESAQVLTFVVTGNSNPALFAVAPAVTPGGTLTFTPAPNASGTATITLTLHDDGGTANGGIDTSAPQTFVVTVTDVNDPPSFTKGADVTVNEDSGAYSAAWATAISPGPAPESGQTVAFTVTGNTNAALFAAAPAVSPAGVLTFTPAANANGTATITLSLHDSGGTANGGVDTSAPQTFVVTVTPVNDAPSFTKGADQTVNEDAGPQTVSPWATAVAAGPADESGQTVTFNLTGNTNPGLFSAGPAISPTGVLTYTPAANANGTATLSVVVQDNGGTANGGADTSAVQTFVVTVNAVNDAPSFTKGPDQSANDNAGPVTVSPWATGISAGPANEAGQTLAFLVTGNTDPTLFAAGPSISPTGALTYTPAIVPAGTHSSTITIRLQDNGGTANGGVDTSAAQTFTISITHVNVAPSLTTNPITYSTPGNTQLHVAGATLPGVASVSDASSALAKAVPTDPDGPSAPSVVPATGTTANGSSYSIAADGSFTFVPAAGFTGTDSFTYTVTDQNPGTPGTVTGTIGVTVGQRVWYVRDVVDANNAAGGDGRSTNAFDSIAAFNAATTNDGDVVFVFRGNTGTTPLSGGFTLRNGQKLWGEGIGLTVTGFGTLVPAGQQPRVSNGSGDAVSVPATASSRQNVEVRGLDLAGSGNAVDVTASGANAVSVTITNNTVSAAGLEGIDLNAGSTGTFAATVSNNTVTATGNGIDARTSAATTLTLVISNDTVTSSATGIYVDGSAGGTTTITGFVNNAIGPNNAGNGIFVASAKFDATPGGGYDTVSGGTTVVGVSGNGVGANGILMTNVSGDLAFTDLDVFADSGAALSVTGTGAVNVGAGTGTRVTVGAGVATLEATGGPAVSVTNATVDLQLSSLKSTNSSGAGVSLNAVSGTFSAPAGSSISNATGTDFVVIGGNATVSYGGTISDDVGVLVAVSTTAGGTYAFTGAITDGNDGDGSGVVLTTNPGSTITFSGGLVLSTGGNPAFTATGGGTVRVCDENPCGASGSNGALVNTLATTTGTALNVTGTTIGAGDLEFRSISSNGGTSTGIILDTTGATGGLKVKGTGSAGSGGTIANKTGADGSTTTGVGIYLNATSNVSLDRMQLNDFQNFAIRGLGVTGFTLSNSVINGTNGNNAAGGFNEGSVSFSNLAGSVSVTSTGISGGFADNFRVVNASGTLNRITFSSVTVGANSAANGNDGITLEAQGASTLNVTVQNSTFTSSRGDLFQLNLLGSSVSDLVFTGNTLSNNHPAIATGGGGVTISGGDNTTPSGVTLTYSISNNSFRDADGHGILIVKSTDPGSFTGTFSNNTVGVAAASNSGSKAGSGIKLQTAGLGTFSASVTNNQIRQYNNFGIELLTGGSAAAMGGVFKVAVTGNTISNPGTGGLPMNGIHLNGGTVPGDTYAICVDIGGAGALANTINGSGANGGTDVRVRQRQSTTVRLPGYVGANDNDSAVQGYLIARNTVGTAPTALAQNTVVSGGGGFIGGAACLP